MNETIENLDPRIKNYILRCHNKGLMPQYIRYKVHLPEDLILKIIEHEVLKRDHATLYSGGSL